MDKEGWGAFAEIVLSKLREATLSRVQWKILQQQQCDHLSKIQGTMPREVLWSHETLHGQETTQQRLQIRTKSYTAYKERSPRYQSGYGQ